MKLVIAGSRTVAPTIEEIDREVRKLVEDSLGLSEVDDYHGPGGGLGPRDWVKEVISGDASGADTCGSLWARHHGIPLHHDPVTPDDIARHGKWLGPKMRNRRMAERATHALIFWDGESTGSADMCTRMVARRKPVEVVPMRKAVKEKRAARREERAA